MLICRNVPQYTCYYLGNCSINGRFNFKMASCIQGFHVYQDNWTPIFGERLVCKNEPGNPRDRYAVAVYKGNEIVGHLPRNISTMSSIFIWCIGIINHKVLGGQQYSRDLPQGGMEIPCTLHFAGNESELKKVAQLFSSISSILTTTQPQHINTFNYWNPMGLITYIGNVIGF